MMTVRERLRIKEKRADCSAPFTIRLPLEPVKSYQSYRAPIRIENGA